MRRLVLVSVLLLAGCAGTTGPRMRDADPKPVDPPNLPTYLQRERALATLPNPNINYGVTPRTWQELPEDQWGKPSH
jgi:hypothetical protein